MDDIIYIEDMDAEEDFFDDAMPIVGIAELPDGTLTFQTTLSGPAELLLVLEAIKKQILEEAFG